MNRIKTGGYSPARWGCWSSWIKRAEPRSRVKPRKFIRRWPIEQTPVTQRMLESECRAYCHNRQVLKIRVCDRERHARKGCLTAWALLMAGDCGKNLWYALAQAIPED